MDRARVLIVDDNIGTSESLTLLLRKRGYETDWACTGMETLSIARRKPFDLAFLDLQLPDIEGSDLISQLKKIHPDIAIIVVTGNISLDAAMHAIKERVFLFLTKPLNMDIVLARVEEAIRDQRRAVARRRAMEALGESEEKYRLMTEIGKDVIFQCDATGKILYCSPAVERLLGYTQEEVIGSPYRRFFHPPEIPRAEEAFQQVISGEDIELQEYHVRNRNGDLLPIEINTVPLMKGSEIIGAQGIMRDIRERRRAHEAIQRRDRILEAISFSAQRLMLASKWKDMILQVLERLGQAADVCRVYLFENHAGDNGALLFSQRFEWVGSGVTPQIDNPILQNCDYQKGGLSRWVRDLENGRILHGHVRDFPESEREILSSRETQSMAVVPIFAGNGWWGFLGFDSCREERIWRAVEQEALKAAAGTIGAAIHREIVERQLDMQRSLMKETFEGLVEGIGLVDQDEQIIFCNPAYAAIFDDRPENLIGKHLRDFVDPETYQIILRQTEERRKGKSSTYEIPVHTKEGKRRHVRIVASPRFGEDGSYIGAFGSILDITGEVEAKKALGQAETRAREILETSPAVLYRCDIGSAGGEEWSATPTFVSENIERIFGYKAEACIGNQNWWREHVHPDDLPGAIQEMEVLFRQGRLTHEYRIRKRDGCYRWVADDVLLIRDPGGKPAAFVGSWMDITERKEAEEDLKRSQRILYEAEQMAHLGSWDWDIERNETRQSDEAYRILGLEPFTPMNYDRFLPLVHPDDRAAFIRSVTDVLEGKPLDIEFRIVRPDGSVRYVHSIARVTFDISGRPMRMMGTIHDITDSVKVKEALKESERKYRRIVDDALVGIFQTNIQGELLFANSTAMKMAEFDSLDEAIAHGPLGMYDHPDDRGRMIGKLKGEEGKMNNFPFDMTTRKGNRRHLLVNLSLHGEIITGIVVDVSKQKEAEARLRQSQELLTSAQRIARMGSWEWDPKRNEAKWSDEVYRIFGCEPQEFPVGYEKFEEFLHPDDRKRIRALAFSPVQDEAPTQRHFRIIRRDGSIRYIRTDNEILRDDEGKIIKLYGTLQDVTEQTLAEKELLNSQEQLRRLAGHLQSIREEERAKVARDIHDEVGQSLTALRIELSRIGGQIPASARGLKKEIRPLIKQIDSAIEAVRRISAELRPGMLDHIGLEAAVEDYAADFQARTGIGCRVEAEPFGSTIDVDRSIAVFRIFQELLTNVARHAHATQVEARLARHEGLLVMTVQDNGKGIRKENLTGPRALGITGMKERLYPWGGEIVFKGRRGKGTSVTVEIPLENRVKGGQDDPSSSR